MKVIENVQLEERMSGGGIMTGTEAILREGGKETTMMVIDEVAGEMMKDIEEDLVEAHLLAVAEEMMNVRTRNEKYEMVSCLSFLPLSYYFMKLTKPLHVTQTPQEMVHMVYHLYKPMNQLNNPKSGSLYHPRKKVS